MGAWRSALPSHLHLLAWKSRTNNPITPIQQATVFVCEEGGGGEGEGGEEKEYKADRMVSDTCQEFE